VTGNTCNSTWSRAQPPPTIPGDAYDFYLWQKMRDMILLPGGSNMVATNGGMTLFPISEGDPIDASLNWRRCQHLWGGFSEDTPYYFWLSFDIGDPPTMVGS
jgi:hypothetical protein